MHICECLTDALFLNVFAFSIAKLNEGICIPTLHMSLLSSPEYNVTMVTREKNKYGVWLGFVKCLCIRPLCVHGELAEEMVWLQVSAQKINKSNICIGKLMRLVSGLMCTSLTDAHCDPSLTSQLKHNAALEQKRTEMGLLHNQFGKGKDTYNPMDWK